MNKTSQHQTKKKESILELLTYYQTHIYKKSLNEKRNDTQDDSHEFHKNRTENCTKESYEIFTLSKTTI